MRKSPEARDDVAMQLGVFHELSVAERFGEHDAALLQRQILRVLERHVEEDPQRGICRRIEAALDRAQRHALRQRIRRKCVRAVGKMLRGI